jgi:putative peptidoglycan lipid II flippase
LYLPGGSVTALSSAFHLWQLPVALFGVAVGMVVLPSVSRMSLHKGNDEIPQHLAKAMRFVAFFAVPSAVFLSIWGTEIVSVFYQRGRFDAAASEFTGNVLAAYSAGLLAYAGMKVLQPVFLALEKPWAPAGLAVVAFCISVGCNYTFVHILGMPAMYLALTTSIVTTLNFVFYFLYLRHLLGSMSCQVLVPGVLRIVGAGALLALACYLVHVFCFGSFTEWSFLARFGALALGGIGGAAVYGIGCVLFRVPEMQAVISRFLRRG